MIGTVCWKVFVEHFSTRNAIFQYILLLFKCVAQNVHQDKMVCMYIVYCATALPQLFVAFILVLLIYTTMCCISNGIWQFEFVWLHIFNGSIYYIIISNNKTTVQYFIHISRQSFQKWSRLMKWTKIFQNIHIKSEHYIRSIDGRTSIYVTTKHFKCIFITGSKWWIPYVEEFSRQIWYFIYQ